MFQGRQEGIFNSLTQHFAPERPAAASELRAVCHRTPEAHLFKMAAGRKRGKRERFDKHERCEKPETCREYSTFPPFVSCFAECCILVSTPVTDVPTRRLPTRSYTLLIKDWLGQINLQPTEYLIISTFLMTLLQIFLSPDKR